MPSIEIDSQSGFCFGVVTAIRKAEEELARGGTLYCLGDIVHNSDEVERLRKTTHHRPYKVDISPSFDTFGRVGIGESRQ